ncbi:MAG TPA: ATP-binding protein [Aquella sp.]|nr:ATP-binding protein [Aquella sp.]
MTQDVTDYFPSKLATGKAFCNRVNELKLLNLNVNKGRHVVIYSPRRYGKSSLVNKVVTDLNLPHAVIDLFLAHDDRMINKRIMIGISHILSRLLSPTEKVLKKVQDSFRNFKVTLGSSGFDIESSFSPNTSDTVDQIHEALGVLDGFAKEKKEKVIIFFDEFQDITNSKSSKSIQGAIRNIAQSTNNIVFIFSGSYQHMLAELFDEKSMPLYMLCDKIYLERILAHEYKKHINQIAQIKWDQALELTVLDKILNLTEAHAFYINMLCNILFELPETPTYNDIGNAWNQCQEIEHRRIVSDIQSLSVNQQDILRQIAINNPNEPFGNDFTLATGKAQSTIKQCISVLLKKDFVYKVNREDLELDRIKLGQYRVLDPLISTVLRKLS